MTGVEMRPYRSDDLPACLRLFDSNVPAFFAPPERAEFRMFLEEMDAPDRSYLVLELDDRIVACGGLWIDAAAGSARLSWGMVDRARHGRGLGTRLTTARLTAARAMAGIKSIGLATSQHTNAFYEKFGFSITSVTRDGFGPGLDCYEMVQSLVPDAGSA